MVSVLYVDDEPDLLEIAKIFLEQDADFSVETALSAAQARDLIGSRSYDAVVSDYMMPGMDGIALLKVVRQQHGDMPFILFTGRGREEVVIEAINNGADFYLQKGGDPRSQFAELMHKIRQAVARRRAELLRIESEKRLADIIDFLPDAMFAIDTEGTVISWNRAIGEMTGIPASQMLKKGNYEYAIPFYGERRPILIDLVFETDETIGRFYSRITRDGTMLSAETDLARPKGDRIVVLAKASPLYNRQGDVVGAIESIRDITDRVRSETDLRSAYEQLAASEEALRSQLDALAKNERLLRESRERLRSFMESATDAFTIWDADLNLADLNQVALSYLPAGIRKEDVIGRNLEELLPGSLEKGMVARYRDVIRTGIPYTGSEMLPGTAYGRCWLTIRAFKVGDGMGIVTSDISREKQAEEELRAAYEQLTASEEELRSNLQEIVRTQQEKERSEKNFRSLVDNAPYAISIQVNKRFVYVNRATVRLFGAASADDLLGENPEDRIHPGSRGVVKDRVRSVTVDGSNPPTLDAVYLKLDGTPVDVAVTGVPFVYGGERGVLVILHDISERKRSETELRAAYERIAAAEEELRSQYEELAAAQRGLLESRQRLAGIADSVPGVVYQFFARRDGSRGFSYISSSASEVFGIAGDLGLSLEQLTARVDPRDREAFMDSIQKAIATESPWDFEGRFIKPSGETIWFQGLSRPVRQGDGVIFNGVLLDITGRKKAEAALRKSEEKYRNVIEHAPYGIHFYELVPDRGLVFTGANPSADRLLKVSHDRFIGRTIEEAFPGLAGTEVPDRYRNVAQTGSAWQKEQVDYHEGAISGGYAITAFRTAPSAMAVTFVDITEKKRAEEALRESEEKYRRILENLQDAYIRTDERGTVTMVNPSAARMYRYGSVEEMIGIPAVNLYLRPTQREVLLRRLQEEGGVIDFSGEALRKDGTVFSVSINVQFFRDAGGRILGTEGIARDVSERKAMERAIREVNRKLSLLGSITRHDVANKVAVISGFTRAARMKNPDPAVLSFLEKIEAAGSDISQQIAFTKAYQELGMHAPGWQGIRELVVRQKTDNVALSCTCDAEVFADPMLGQVIHNLVDNAIRHGERVTGITVSCALGKGGLVIVVEDDGIGIPADLKEEIFGRGFGKHTGYGLFLAREILAITGIAIKENGTPGRGARFEITVPEGSYRITPRV